tara:strand:+ start:700 stop:1290 length:591 start_codon:yes stop_codon:yes gene_type:complete
MCDATAITMAIISVGSAAVTYQGQQEQAAAQAKYQKAQFDAREQQRKDNRKLAVRSMINKTSALNEQLAQKRSIDADEKQRVQRQKLKAKSKVYTSAMENNAIGGSLNALLGDFDRQEGIFLAGVNKNQFFRERNLEYQKESEFDVAMGRMQAIQPFIPAPVAQPSFMGMALNVANEGVGIYDGYKRRTDPNWKGL